MSWATALPSSQFSSLLLREPGVREYRCSGVQACDELGHRIAFLSVLEPALEEAGRSGVQACDELGHRNAVLSV